jgi:hypothetical protein
MRSLNRVVKYQGAGAEPIPQVIPGLAAVGYRQRRGQLSLVIAPPGGGKSLMAMQTALNVNVPTLYVSADQDAQDTIYRVARHLGWDGVDDNELPSHLARMNSHVWFCFDSSPTAADLAQECEAHAMVLGYWPELIVVDTLAKVWGEGEDETSRAKHGIERCQELARETGAHVMVLHHLQKAYDVGDRAPSLDGVLSGVTKIPESVLGIWRNTPTQLGFNVLKNRSGRADASGNTVRAYANVDFENFTLTEVASQQYSWENDIDLREGVV